MALLPRYARIEDIPGERIPSIQKVSITLDSGASTYTDSIENLEVGNDGPFIVTQLQSYTRVLATSQSGSSQPGNGLMTPSSIYSNIRALTSATQTTATPGGPWQRGSQTQVLGNVGEVEFRLAVQGTGQFWTGEDVIPGAAFYGFGSVPGYLGVVGWADPGDRVQLTVRPRVNLAARVDSIMVFTGVTILNPDVRLADLLGVA